MAGTWVNLKLNTDFTVDNRTLTLLSTPVPGETYALRYSYSTGARTHDHEYEEKESWGGGSTWLLSRVPDMGEFILLRSATTIPLWIIYGPDTGMDVTGSSLRRALLDETNATFLNWDTAEITGWDDPSGEYFTCMAAHPTDKTIVYVATTDGSEPRIYRCAAGVLTRVYKLEGAASGQGVKQLYVENDGTVWMIIGLVNYTAPFPPAEEGVYKSDTSGQNFTKMGRGWAGTQFLYDGVRPSSSMESIVVKESAPRRIWVGHTHLFLPNDALISYSDDEGITWTDLAGTARDQFSYGTDFCLQGYPRGDHQRISYSYNHFASNADTYHLDGSTLAITKAGGFSSPGQAVVHFLDDPDDRIGIILGSGQNNFSSDGGVGWGNTSDIEPIELRGLSVHPSKYWVATAPSTSVVRISLNKGTTYAVSFPVPSGRPKLVAWLGGQN